LKGWSWKLTRIDDHPNGVKKNRGRPGSGVTLEDSLTPGYERPPLRGERLARIALILASAFACTTAAAQDDAPLPGPEPALPADDIVTAENAPLANELTPQLADAVEKGFRALAALQDKQGFWGGMRNDRHVGISALAGIAFLADGNLPGRGPYADQVERVLDFLLTAVAETGLIAEDTSHGPMYGHGFATLFLGEVYGMTAGGPNTPQSTRLYEALVKACRLIVETQNQEGGWRYNPVPNDADVSVTICQVMGLRSARNAGIEVPKATIDRAIEYVRECQNPDGGFRYQTMQGGSAWPRTAAGVASLYYAGIYRDDALDRGLTYLIDHAAPNKGLPAGSHYFYGHYYAVQSMYLAGGDKWASWWPAIRDELISTQNADGTWDDTYAGPAYGTAMALIILQMPKRYLPIFQK
jgi:hypothetical protein